jgi:hypothetical protein
MTGTPIEEHIERFMTNEDRKALPIRNDTKIGLKWSNKWLKDLNKEEYRKLVWPKDDMNSALARETSWTDTL